jgi:hypothetical protein
MQHDQDAGVKVEVTLAPGNCAPKQQHGECRDRLTAAPQACAALQLALLPCHDSGYLARQLFPRTCAFCTACSRCPLRQQQAVH